MFDFVGCTANVCYIEQASGKAYVANLGDSRSVSCNTNAADYEKDFTVVALSNDHIPGDPVEK